MIQNQTQGNCSFACACHVYNLWIVCTVHGPKLPKVIYITNFFGFSLSHKLEENYRPKTYELNALLIWMLQIACESKVEIAIEEEEEVLWMQKRELGQQWRVEGAEEEEQQWAMKAAELVKEIREKRNNKCTNLEAAGEASIKDFRFSPSSSLYYFLLS